MAHVNNFTTASTTPLFIVDADDDDDGESISMENLYPALVQCFAIIICG